MGFELYSKLEKWRNERWVMTVQWIGALIEEK